MADEQRPRLGRGLAALIGDTRADPVLADRGARRIAIDVIRPNPRNPRKTFDDAALSELADSVREKGVIQPLVVRLVDGGSREYEIIAGERRWRAAQKAGLHDVPAIIVSATERESLELAIIENVQRADLNAIEEGGGYQQLMSEFAYTQADVARIVGKSRSHVANTLRLLHLPESVRRLVEGGSLTAGHARALLAVDDPEEVARRVVAEGMNVRDVEELAQRGVEGRQTDSAPKELRTSQDPHIRDLEKSLSDALGLRVRIASKGESGEIRIRYSTIEQFDSLRERLL
jgi:ParB family transcriptional regulator, chromosome partitioning protein